MKNNSQQHQDFSSLLLQNQQYFPHQQPIINFIRQEPKSFKKIEICGWNQNSIDKNNQVYISSGFNYKKKCIQDFLSSIKSKNNQYNNFRSKLLRKNRKSRLQNDQINQKIKNDIFLPLNNTIIAFPKSRSESRKIESQQKAILQKLYRKRQKSKVIPKQISISPTAYSTLNSYYPSKDYLSKNRSFINDGRLIDLCNPELKIGKQVGVYKKRFSTSYHKKINGIFLGNDRMQKLMQNDQYKKLQIKEVKSSQRNQNRERKLTILNQMNSDLRAGQSRFYKTLYNTYKKSSIDGENQNQFSVSKIREVAKNSYLNRKRNNSQKIQIQLIGSPISQWKTKALQKLKEKEEENKKNKNQ